MKRSIRSANRFFVLSQLALAVAFWVGSAQAQVTITSSVGNPRTTGTVGAYYVPIKTDLANSGQATFSSLATTYTNDWNGGNQARLNDGNPASNGYGGGKWNSAHYDSGPFPAVQTFTFDTTLNPNGYDISSIISASTDWSDGRVWQTYTLEYHTVGGGWAGVTGDGGPGGYTVNRTGSPFGGGAAGGNAQHALVTLERLALSRVDQLRFTTPGARSAGCTAWSEIDILGAASGDADVIWSSASDGAWETGTNWAGGTAPGANDNAIFNGGGTVLNVTPDAGRNVRNVTFDTASAGAYVLGTAGGNALTLSSGGSVRTTPAVANTQNVNAPLALAGANGMYAFTSDAADNTTLLNIGGGITGGAAGKTVLTLSGANTGANTVGGVIANGSADTVSIAKYGTGAWVLSGSNTYTGTTMIGGGALQANNVTALGNGGDITFTGGTLQFGSVLNGASLDWGARIKSSILGGAIALDSNGQAVTLAGNIPGSNTGGLTKLGANTLTLPATTRTPA